MVRGMMVRLSAVAALVLTVGVTQLGAGASAAPRDTTAARGTAAHAAHALGSVPTLTANLVLTFEDPLNSFHPMGITSDGRLLYTTNGGNSGSCRVNTFDLTGSLIRTRACSLDNRDIHWNPLTGTLYTKDYFQSEYSIDPRTGQSTLVGPGWYAHPQSSPALTPDGNHILEQEDGTIRFMRWSDGHVIRAVSGFAIGGYPSSEAVAMDGQGHILTWDENTVSIQDANHTLLATVPIPFGHYGFSLSFAHGLLFTADDVGGSGSATWYGYEISP
jgi:hypothetical protein